MTTEIINPVIKRVDAVDGPATGQGFLILKSEELPVLKDDGTELVPDVEATDVQDGANVAGQSVDDADAAMADPGAPAWEAVDAAKARTATAALVQIRDDLKELAARESAEDDDASWENTFNLSDAASALDFALATLAKFAVDEQNEADAGQISAEADARALGLIKALHRVHPEGVTTVTTETPIFTEAAAAAVVKADEALVAVYDQNGNLLGAVASDALTPLATAPDAGSDAATDGDAPAADAPADPAAPVVAAEAAPAPAAPAAAAPAAPVAPADPDDPNNVTKSLDALVAEAVAKALTAAVATAVEPLVKSNEEMADRLLKMEQTPRDNGPMLNGQRPGINGPALRGQTRDDAEALRKQLQDESDPGAKVTGVAALINQMHQGR